MGLIAKLLSYVPGIVKADAGGGQNLTAQHYSTPGDDAQPVPSDYVAMIPVPGSGKYVAVGYLDPDNAQTAGPGGKRIYSRGPDGGVAVAELWLKNDGTIIVNGDEILLGKDAVNRLIDERLISLYNSHTHSTTTAGAPTGTPIVSLTVGTVATTKTKAE